MITKQQHFDTLNKNAQHRVQEIYAYQLNIDTYTLILQNLNSKLPNRLKEFAQTPADELPLDMDFVDVESISNHQYCMKLERLLRTEKLEQNKSKCVLQVLKQQLGPHFELEVQT